MGEPKYDEDIVNLGYLKKQMSEIEKNINNEYKEVSRHYGSKPTPPYNKGDTWIDGNIVYTCINSREVGVYKEEDWITESGAKEEAKKKNRVFLTKPNNYDAGDMWILQSDTDHKAGKKGEILITTVGRNEYDEHDWVNMLSYGNISSINEVLDDLSDAITRIGVVEEAVKDGVIVTYYQDAIPEAKNIGDLWYVTADIENFKEGKMYRYDGETWQMLEDSSIAEAFSKANEARLVADGKIQSFYSDVEPIEGLSVGDLWVNTADSNKLYRYNGTNWIPVYDTRVEEIISSVEVLTTRLVEISTDLGQITQTVTEKENKITTELDNVKEEQKTIQTQYSQTKEDFNFWFNTLTETINSNNEDTNKKLLEISKYIRFVDGNIVLGEVGNQYELKIENDRINIYYNGQSISDWTKDKFNASDGEFTNSLKLGKFAFIPRSNGNLSFKKVVD